MQIWPIFYVPYQDTHEVFRYRLNGQDLVYMTADEGFYDYAVTYLQGWTGGLTQVINGGIPSGTYTVELADSAGQSWGRSAPLLISSGTGFYPPSSPPPPQMPAVVFTNFDGQVGSWNIDPTTQDSDAATDEIAVTNLVDEDVVVERCLIAAGRPELLHARRHRRAGSRPPHRRDGWRRPRRSPGDHQALFIHLASDAAQSYQRDLVLGSNESPNSCQMERIIVHGRRAAWPDSPSSLTQFAMSSCYGYGSGGIELPAGRVFQGCRWAGSVCARYLEMTAVSCVARRFAAAPSTGSSRKSGAIRSPSAAGRAATTSRRGPCGGILRSFPPTMATPPSSWMIPKRMV